MPEFRMCLMQYIAKVTTEIAEQLSRRRRIPCQAFKTRCFAKIIMPECG